MFWQSHTVTFPVSPTMRRLATITFCSIVLLAQKPSVAQEAQPQDRSPSIQVKVNVLLVPVVVRDASGHEVGNLRKENFKVFDNGKPRTISALSVQKGTAMASDETSRAPGSPASTPSTASGTAVAIEPRPAASRRFIAFLFDDRHLGVANFVEVQKAAVRMLEQPLADSDTAVVLSLSGINSGMTQDHRVLQAAILKMKPPTQDEHPCPNIGYYSADQIANKNNPAERKLAMHKTLDCTGQTPALAQSTMEAAVTQAVITGDQDSRESLGYIGGVVRTLAQLSGQRSLILVSPGFPCISNDARNLESHAIELAADSNVTISSVDARGLSSGMVDATTVGVMGATVEDQQSHFESQRENNNVMAELADGTGGTFFHDSNDRETGLRRLIEKPEYLYVLEVSLQDVKPDGSYHPLKVEVDQSGLKPQARRGYFAPMPPKGKK